MVCPHCEQVFEMDAAGYADIVKQIKDVEFETEIHERLQSEQEKHLLAIKVAEAKIKEDSAKNIHLYDLKNDELEENNILNNEKLKMEMENILKDILNNNMFEKEDSKEVKED